MAAIVDTQLAEASFPWPSPRLQPLLPRELPPGFTWQELLGDTDKAERRSAILQDSPPHERSLTAQENQIKTQQKEENGFVFRTLPDKTREMAQMQGESEARPAEGSRGAGVRQLKLFLSRQAKSDLALRLQAWCMAARAGSKASLLSLGALILVEDWG